MRTNRLKTVIEISVDESFPQHGKILKAVKRYILKIGANYINASGGLGIFIEVNRLEGLFDLDSDLFEISFQEEIKNCIIEHCNENKYDSLWAIENVELNFKD